MSSHKISWSAKNRIGTEHLARFKGGELLRSGAQVYFAPDNQDHAYVYDEVLLDFLMEWGNTPMVLTPEQQTVVEAAEMKNDIPLRCELKNGTVHAFCELSFIDHPPHPHFFEGREKWYYIHEIATMQLCPYRIPVRVMKALQEVMRFNTRLIERLKKIGGSDDPRFDEVAREHRYVVVKDTQGRLYKFDDLLSPYVENNTIPASEFELVHQATAAQIESARDISYFDYNERSPRPEGNVVVVKVFADLTPHRGAM